MAQHVAISTFDATSWGRVDHPVLIDAVKRSSSRRKSSQIELRGIQVQRDTITQTEMDEEGQQRSIRVARQTSLTDWHSQHDEKIRSITSDDALSPAAQYALKFDVSPRY